MTGRTVCNPLDLDYRYQDVRGLFGGRGFVVVDRAVPRAPDGALVLGGGWKCSLRSDDCVRFV